MEYIKGFTRIETFWLIRLRYSFSGYYCEFCGKYIITDFIVVGDKNLSIDSHLASLAGEAGSPRCEAGLRPQRVGIPHVRIAVRLSIFPKYVTQAESLSVGLLRRNIKEKVLLP